MKNIYEIELRLCGCIFVKKKYNSEFDFWFRKEKNELYTIIIELIIINNNNTKTIQIQIKRASSVRLDSQLLKYH